MRLRDLFLKQKSQEEEVVSIDSCPKAQKVLSRYGYQIVCPEDLEAEEKPSSDPYCENAKKVASKYGVVITCPE